MRFDFRLMIAVGAALTASCRSPVQPLGDTYVLRSIAGIALPAAYAPNLDLPARKLADTLFLRGDGTGEIHATIEEALGGAVIRQDGQVTYTQHGNDLEVSYVCPSNAAAQCLAQPHLTGRLTFTGILFDRAAVSRAPLVYERVRP
jgi:hypothetical protein